MMATLANKEFARLYKVDDIAQYASLKDGIFQRYRYVSAKKPYISTKEPYISAKESDIESDGSAAAEEVEEDGEED